MLLNAILWTGKVCVKLRVFKSRKPADGEFKEKESCIMELHCLCSQNSSVKKMFEFPDDKNSLK